MDRRICFLCGCWETDYNRLQVHHIFQGRGRRQISEKYGLKLTLCERCHEQVHHSKETADYLHRYGQKRAMLENNWTKEQFIAVFGKNYLD